MSIGIFTDKENCPDDEQILEVLGRKKTAWIEFTGFIRENYSKQEDMRFYGKNYGWALRFRKNGKAFISFYPKEKSFVVQLILKSPCAETALNSSINDEIKNIIKNANPYSEGRWLFIPIKSAKDIKDVKYLLSLKIQKFKDSSIKN
jgi:hypothetical protein